MIFNMVGGGVGGAGGGATLVVSSPTNVSITVSKDDKSYTKNSGSLGSTTFKGLATGTWTIVATGNGQTVTRTIEITADYAITIAFFSASINITYPANSTCVVTNSNGQTVASDTNTTSSTKTWIATVSAIDTYTVTATATDGSEKSKSQSVEITTQGQSISVTLSYELELLSSTSGLADGYSVSGTAVRPAIDVTNYSTLTIVAQLTYQAASGLTLNIGLKSTTGGDLVAYKTISSTSKKTLSLSISSLTGLYYLGADYSMSYSNGTIGITNSGVVSATIYSVKFA